MRNRSVSLLLFAAVALVAVYGRRTLLRSASTGAASAEVATRSAPAEEGEGASAADGGGRRRRSGPRTGPTQPGSFDFYLLNLSWSPEFCATHPGKPECAANPRFVLHGLWPQNNDGTYPEHCSNAPGPSDPGNFTDIFPDSGLLAHEWQTHGTCSGLGADAYLGSARKALHEVVIPPSLAQIASPVSRSPQDILQDFAKTNPSFPAGSLALSCGNNYLTAIEACLDKSLKPIACSGVHTCGAQTVRVVPPGGSD